ncbi:MAG: TaqI-like C-terminal specificity domain-containing protein [Leptolyngbya sp.]|nr:TaqI-like C-terminal specificity domain-containing protein [Leptolyngbya sp.]
MISSAFKRGDYYCISYARDTGIDYFESPKIIAPQRSSSNTFAYNESSWYASADVYFMTAKDRSSDLKYILALLNSRLYFTWLYHRGKLKGETLELYLTPLSEIPIKKIARQDQNPFVDIVNKIIFITQDSGYFAGPEKQAQVKEYEKQIDRMVYELYGLTEEEIEIVERKIKP